jgi:hypothetical protein
LDLVLDLLCTEAGREEEFVFPEVAHDGLSAVIDLTFAFAPEPAKEIDELMKLAWKLGLEMRSPTAASVIRDVLANDPRVNALQSGVDEREARAVTARWSGVGEPALAPCIDAKAPSGTVKLSAIINPLNTARARQERAKALRSANE